MCVDISHLSHLRALVSLVSVGLVKVIKLFPETFGGRNFMTPSVQFMILACKSALHPSMMARCNMLPQATASCKAAGCADACGCKLTLAKTATLICPPIIMSPEILPHDHLSPVSSAVSIPASRRPLGWRRTLGGSSPSRTHRGQAVNPTG